MRYYRIFLIWLLFKMFSTACYRLVFIILCHFIFQFATSFLFVVRWFMQSANVLFFA